ncbi:MAG TPA: GGDEF domain-containing protein [Candidatus Dojkabacteria bacterium]|nr:GGDEF domain-containing protein [Candidatus Dojkabacteria bacterium]
MELDEVLKPILFVIDDNNLDIVISSTKTYVGTNFIYLVAAGHKEAFIKELNTLKKDKYVTISTPLVINRQNENFQINVFKADQRYYIQAIPIDTISNLIYELNNLEEYAYTDQLTGALNRYAYWEMLLNLLYDIEREKKSLGMIFVDIDNLKRINTEKGYQGGDYVITTVADVIKDTKRKSDLLVRLGGDEFLVLGKMDKAKEFTIEDFAMRILKKVRKLNDPYISVSMGAYNLKTSHIKELTDSKDWKKEWNKVIVYLDKLLRTAKKSGKDRIYTKSGELL